MELSWTLGTATSSVQEEISAVVNFLTKLDRRVFKKSTWDSIEVLDPREVVLIASLVPSSFFIRIGEDQSLDAFQVKLPSEFANRWAADLEYEFPGLLSGDKPKIVRFIRHWVPTWSQDSPYLKRKKRETLHEYKQEIEKMGFSLSDVLFVPFFEYRSGVQLGEGIYHYIIGLLLKESGYLVCDEYVLSSYFGERPDLSAFRTDTLDSILKELWTKGIISSGAFLQELQLYKLFKRRGKLFRPRSYEPLQKRVLPPEVHNVAVEIERAENQRKGKSQLLGYLLGTQGLYNEGYVAGPFLEPEEGVLTFQSDGELVFQRAQPSYQTVPLHETLAERRKNQLDQIEFAMKLQLMKNFSINETLNLCSFDHREIDSYLELEAGIRALDFGQIIDALCTSD